MTTIYDTDDEGNIIVLFDSRWQFPELLGYSPSDPEYKSLQRMWEEQTGKRIPREVVKTRRLTRDKVISVVKGKELVGVYWEGTDLGSPSARKKKDLGSPSTRKKKEAERRMKTMAKQGSNNNRINNSQRAVLAKLAVEVLDKKIQQARDESGDLVAQIRRQVKEELGVAAMDMEVAEMEKRIQVLKKKKEQLGFNQYNDGLLAGSQAKMLVDERTGTACKKVRELEEKKTDVVSQIWTSITMSDALSILENVKRL
jgi:hypothetical protein